MKPYHRNQTPTTMADGKGMDVLALPARPSSAPATVDYLKIPDEELMQAYQKGDGKAFEILLKRHQKGVYNFLYRFLEQEENVEEAFQEVFVRVIRSSVSYTPTAKFSTWIYTIARNYCIDLSRKGRFRMVGSLEGRTEDEEGLWEERIADDTAKPESEVSAKNLSQKLEESLQRINSDQREVFLMRERLGLPFEEIAKIVGSSVNTVKSRMRYALVALQEEFKKLGISDLK